MRYINWFCGNLSSQWIFPLAVAGQLPDFPTYLSAGINESVNHRQISKGKYMCIYNIYIIYIIHTQK